MKRKHFILALVAMLWSFSFSTFAATTVTTEAELKDALTTDNEVTLGADIKVTEMIVVPNGVIAILDLNGHAITSGYQTGSDTKHIYPLDVYGDLTIKDTKGDGSITGRGIYVQTGCKLTVDGGYIYGIDTNGGSALFQYGGDIVINGGHIEQKATGTSNFAVNAAGGTVEVNGGWVGGNHGAIAAVNDAVVTIDDGTFVCTGTAGMTDNVIYTAGDGSITVNGGTFEGDSDGPSGGCCVYDSNGKTTVNGGSFSKSSGGDVWGTTGTTINGGTFENLTETQHVAVGATITNGGKTYTKAENGTMEETTFVAKIGSTTYATLAEALTAASAMSGDVTVEVYDKVTLNTAFSGSYSSINFVGKDTDAEIYLDVQGYITATGKKVSFTDLTLSKSEGVHITNAGFMNVAFGIYDVVEVTYTNCKFANGAYASSGNVTFNGCTFYRSHDKYGLWAYGDVNATVEDCTFADYRGIKMYAEGAAKTVDLTVKDTDFSAVNDKPAIVLTYGESVVLEGNTYSSTGTFELDLDGAPNGTAVTSDVAPTCKNDNGACGVLVDGKIYTTAAQAAEVAAEGSNVTLLYSTTDAVEFAEGVNLTLANGVTADNVTVATSGVAKVGDTTYATLAEAVAAAQAGDEIVLLGDVAEDATLPAGVIFNGNGKQVNGVITAGGEITFAGVTKATNFDVKYVNTVVNIPAGASLQLTGTGRMVIGHGCTFNITGTIEDAKTADKATLVPSLKIAAGASITGNGVTFNVNNAYIVANANTTSKNKAANGTFNFNINNSIWDQTGVLAFYVPTEGMDPTVNFDLKNSVLTTTSHLVFDVTKGEVVIDNSKVNEGVNRQLENLSTMTIKNGSVVNGAVATSSNAKNPGTIIVENATYAVTGEFSGSDLGTGTLIIKKGATVSAGSITKANITIDATDMVAGDEVNLTANLANLAGELSVINNDKLEASIVDGKVVLAAKPVAKIGEQEYMTLEAAFAAATEGQTITMLIDATPALTSQRAITKAAVIDLGGKTLTLTEDDLYFGTTTFKNGTIVVDPSVKPSTAVFWMFANQTLTFDNVKIVATGVTGTYLIGLDGNNSDLNLLNGSEILVENTTALDLDIICVNASTGNDIKVENSKVNVKNLDGRVFFRGNYTVKDSEVNLTGITKAGFRIEAGQTLSIEGTSKVTIEGEPRDGGIHLVDLTSTYTKAETATVNATVNRPAVAKIGDTGYASLAEALTAAQTANLSDVEITIVGVNTQETADDFNLYEQTVFNNVTIKQDNGNKPYYVKCIYPGKRSIAEGQFVFDGVNVVITEQYITQCKTVLKNNSVVKRTDDAKNFIYYADMFVESGSKYDSQIDDILGGSVTVDGGRTDGTYNTEFDLRSIFFDVRTGQVLTAKNGAYVIFNAANEIGRLTLNGKLSVQASKVEVFNNIPMGDGAVIELDTKSLVSAKVITGAGKIVVDATGFAGEDVEVINADMSGFTGTIEVIGDATYEIVDSKVVIKAPTYVAKIGEQGYETLAEALAAAQDNETVTLLADVETADGIVITDKNLVINLNGKTYTTTEGASTNNRNFKIEGTSVVTIKNGTMVAAGDYSSGAYGTVRTEGSANVALEGLKLYNYRGNGLNIKACGSSVVTINDTEIYSNYGGGIESAGGTIEIANVKVEQKGMYTAPYNSMAISVNGGGKVTVNSGTYSTECITAEEANNQGTSHGPWVAGVLNSGGTLIINGGTFSNDNFGENSLATYARGAILADTKAKVEINGGKFNVLKNVIDIQNNLGDANNNPSVVLAGGTYNADPRISASYSSNLITLADGYAALPDLNGNYVVGVKPTATVNNLGMTTVAAGDYSIWNGSFDQNTEDDGNMPLSFVMQFLADQDAEDMETSPYADWYGDFVLTFTGIENGSFTADGCYLAGHYGSFGWVKVPVDGMTIENGVRYPVMLGVGLGQKYDYICSSVEDFKCALYLTPEILAANPNIQVNLELAVVDNSKGSDAAASALVNNKNVYSVTDYTYEAKDFDPNFIRELTIVDGEIDQFVNDAEKTVEKLTYKRTFLNIWNPLFVPFEIPVSALTEKGYEVAYINDLHAADLNGDGKIVPGEDDMAVEYIKLTSGILRANHPYVIKPGDEAETPMELVLEGAVLRKTTEKVSVSFSSAYVEYEVHGTYVKANRQELTGGENCFIINTDGAWQNLSPDENAKINAFRLYMEMRSKDGSPLYVPENVQIRARVIGEKDEVTGIYTPYVSESFAKEGIFDLMGRPVITPEKGKLYIIDGKKVLY